MGSFGKITFASVYSTTLSLWLLLMCALVVAGCTDPSEEVESRTTYSVLCFSDGELVYRVEAVGRVRSNGNGGYYVTDKETGKQNTLSMDCVFIAQ